MRSQHDINDINFADRDAVISRLRGSQNVGTRLVLIYNSRRELHATDWEMCLQSVAQWDAVDVSIVTDLCYNDMSSGFFRSIEKALRTSDAHAGSQFLNHLPYDLYHRLVLDGLYFLGLDPNKDIAKGLEGRGRRAHRERVLGVHMGTCPFTPRYSLFNPIQGDVQTTLVWEAANCSDAGAWLLDLLVSVSAKTLFRKEEVGLIISTMNQIFPAEEAKRRRASFLQQIQRVMRLYISTREWWNDSKEESRSK